MDLNFMKEKYIDFVYEYKGMDFHTFNSKCGIKMIKRNNDDKIVVIATDLGRLGLDYGTSVTNACEKIATKIREDYKILPNDLIFIEHYPEKSRLKETFDLVIFKWGNGEYTSPNWIHLSYEEFEAIING